ncbi:putative reverse transcriptase, RNA-dependent DNA polymerase, LTR copia-type gag-polypeptide [Tanacetum coccineum]
MARDDNNKNEYRGGCITHDSPPYYLHPSDYPKQLHVNKVLTDNNYANWSQEMTNFLFAKIKMEFVDGTIKKHEKTSKEYMPWIRVDAMIKGWLTTAMEKNIRNNVKYADTTSKIWRNGPPGPTKERSGAKVEEEENKHCTECNKDGHTREGCFKLIGYPEWWPGKKGEKTKGKAAYVGTETDPIPGLTYEDYQLFLKHFSGLANVKGKGDHTLLGGAKVKEGLQMRNLIGAGRCEGGLYRMKMVQGRRAIATTVETWHKRLGHASKGKLAKDTAYWGFLGVRTTFDIFQNIHLLYLEYDVLNSLDTMYWILFLHGLQRSVGTDTPYLP